MEGFTQANYPMYSKDTQGKASKGSVQLKISNGRLQLVFSHTGKRHYLSTGLADNKLNRKAVEAKAKLAVFSGKGFVRK